MFTDENAERVMVAEVRANRNSLSAPIDERYFRSLAENIPALCWIADADGYIFWYNRRWYEYTGKTPAEMEGWGWQSVHDPRSLAAVLDHWKAAISSARPFEMVFPIRARLFNAMRWPAGRTGCRVRRVLLGSGPG
jgi:PAS domain-containing protein